MNRSPKKIYAMELAFEIIDKIPYYRLIRRRDRFLPISDLLEGNINYRNHKKNDLIYGRY